MQLIPETLLSGKSERGNIDLSRAAPKLDVENDGAFFEIVSSVPAAFVPAESLPPLPGGQKARNTEGFETGVLQAGADGARRLSGDVAGTILTADADRRDGDDGAEGALDRPELPSASTGIGDRLATKAASPVSEPAAAFEVAPSGRESPAPDDGKTGTEKPIRPDPVMAPAVPAAVERGDLKNDLPRTKGVRVSEAFKTPAFQPSQEQTGSEFRRVPFDDTVGGVRPSLSAFAAVERAGNAWSSLKTTAGGNGVDPLPRGPELRMPETNSSEGEKAVTIPEGGVIPDEARMAPEAPGVSSQAASTAVAAVTSVETISAKAVPDRIAAGSAGFGRGRVVTARDFGDVRQAPDLVVRTSGASGKTAIQLPLVAPNNAPVGYVTGPDFGTRREALSAISDPASEFLFSGSDDQLRAATTERARAEPPAARPILSQVVQSIVRGSGDALIEIRLQPEELGRVRLSITPSEIGTTIQITAERHETLDLLRRNIDLFEADLHDQGFANLNFDFGPETPDHDGSASSEPGTAHEQQKTEREFQRLDVELSQNAHELANGRLDMRI